jgi:hypothetical protein
MFVCVFLSLSLSLSLSISIELQGEGWEARSLCDGVHALGRVGRDKGSASCISLPSLPIHQLLHEPVPVRTDRSSPLLNPPSKKNAQKIPTP